MCISLCDGQCHLPLQLQSKAQQSPCAFAVGMQYCCIPTLCIHVQMPFSTLLARQYFTITTNKKKKKKKKRKNKKKAPRNLTKIPKPKKQKKQTMVTRQVVDAILRANERHRSNPAQPTAFVETMATAKAKAKAKAKANAKARANAKANANAKASASASAGGGPEPIITMLMSQEFPPAIDAILTPAVHESISRSVIQNLVGGSLHYSSQMFAVVLCLATSILLVCACIFVLEHLTFVAVLVLLLLVLHSWRVACIFLWRCACDARMWLSWVAFAFAVGICCRGWHWHSHTHVPAKRATDQ